MGRLSTNALQPPVAFALEIIELTVQASNQIHRFGDRRLEFIALALPSVHTLNLGRPAPGLGVDLLAELALLSDRHRLHDELHATGFTNPVLLGAVLSEVAPLPIATDEPVLVEEAHVSKIQELGKAGSVFMSVPYARCLADRSCQRTLSCVGQTLSCFDWISDCGSRND